MIEPLLARLGAPVLPRRIAVPAAHPHLRRDCLVYICAGTGCAHLRRDCLVHICAGEHEHAFGSILRPARATPAEAAAEADAFEDDLAEGFEDDLDLDDDEDLDEADDSDDDTSR